MAMTYTASGAEISGSYRYRLWRKWRNLASVATARPSSWVLWVMLNPSTADGAQDDQTIRKCVGFSRAWGYDGLEVVNLFALRARDPKALRQHPDPIGPGNDDTIRAMAAMAGVIVCAWGSDRAADGRGRHVLQLLRAYDLKSLGETAKGHPKHPLFLPFSTPLQELGGVMSYRRESSFSR